MKTTLVFAAAALLFPMFGVLATNTCTPGQSFTADDGCNTCSCPDSGLKSEAACTLKACIHQQADDNGTCSPGLSYRDDCNTCQCPDSGLKSEAACTLMLCPEVSDDTCTPGKSFVADDGCNRCICPYDGLKANAGCTRMACPPH